MDILEKRGFKGTVALNSDVCERYPQIIEAVRRLNWEIMGHGPNNSGLLTFLDEAEERRVIGETLKTIEAAWGKRPRGWLSPALSELLATLDILAEQKIDYVADWTNDDQPYPVNVKSGSLYAIPYSLETNDYPAFLNMYQSAETFGQILKDQFDVLYEDGAQTGRVMAICLHPFLIGSPLPGKISRRRIAPHRVAAGSLGDDRIRDHRLVCQKRQSRESLMRRGAPSVQ